MGVIQYDVAFGTSHAEFKKLVREYIAEGWTPIGGVSVAHLGLNKSGDVNVEFLQALVKYDDRGSPA
jgi:hypothetical protein